MPTSLIRSTTSESSIYPIVLMRLDGSHSKPNPVRKISAENQIQDLIIGSQANPSANEVISLNV
jgi:hypothetical protein